MKKGYLGIEQVARKVYSGEPDVKFTGTMTRQELPEGILYTITTSGTLTVSEAVQVWLCGSGASGGTGNNTAFGGGGGGYVASGTIEAGEYPVTIGQGGVSYKSGNTGMSQGGNKTTIGDALTANGGGTAKMTYFSSNGSEYIGGAGGSGGGANMRGSAGNTTTRRSTGGSGAGVSTIPFGIEGLGKHCAGGGGGGYIDEDDYTTSNGGKGGSNGGNGGSAENSYNSSAASGGAGGDKGGGKGGNTTSSGGRHYGANGGNASFYGSGGGGTADSEGYGATNTGGSGYQGVAYILVPA